MSRTYTFCLRSLTTLIKNTFEKNPKIFQILGLQNNGTYVELTEGWVGCEQIKLWRLKKEKKKKKEGRKIQKKGVESGDRDRERQRQANLFFYFFGKALLQKLGKYQVSPPVSSGQAESASRGLLSPVVDWSPETGSPH